MHCIVPTDPFSSDRQQLSYGVCLELGRKIIRTVLYCIVLSSSYSSLDWVSSHLAHFNVRFICVYLCIFCVHLFHTAYLLYYCEHGGVDLILRTYLSSVL